MRRLKKRYRSVNSTLPGSRQPQKFLLWFRHREFTGSTLSLGIAGLGHNCQRLSDLRLETKSDDSICSRAGDDCRIHFYYRRVVDVAGVRRNHVCRLVALETRLLIHYYR